MDFILKKSGKMEKELDLMLLLYLVSEELCQGLGINCFSFFKLLKVFMGNMWSQFF